MPLRYHVTVGSGLPETMAVNLASPASGALAVSIGLMNSGLVPAGESFVN